MALQAYGLGGGNFGILVCWGICDLIAAGDLLGFSEFFVSFVACSIFSLNDILSCVFVFTPQKVCQWLVAAMYHNAFMRTPHQNSDCCQCAGVCIL